MGIFWDLGMPTKKSTTAPTRETDVGLGKAALPVNSDCSRWR
jgi:hypothetical protein